MALPTSLPLSGRHGRAAALAAAIAALAVALPATAGAAAPPDAEVFATNNTAIITDPDDPRLDDPLTDFARTVTGIVRDGGGTPRGSQLLDGVFFSSDLDATTFERSRGFAVDHVDPGELQEIAADIARRFQQQSVLTFDHLPAADPDVDAVELEVPGVTAQALRDGLLADQEARERLFGGSVTLDGRLLLVADEADADFARAFAARLGGDLDRAITRHGDREFVAPRTPAPVALRGRVLAVTGSDGDDHVAIEARGRTLTVDLGADGVPDFAARRADVGRIIVDAGAGQDQVDFAGASATQRVFAGDGRARVSGGPLLELAATERLDLTATRVTVEDLSGTELQEIHGAFAQTVARGTNERDFVDVSTFERTVFVLGLPVLVQIEDVAAPDSLRIEGRGDDDQLSASSLDAAGPRLVLDGGDGSDVLRGGRGDDLLIGGGGEFDDAFGGKGDDVADLGPGFDRFSWAPGDGDDTVDGGAGHDSLFFLGSADAETFDVVKAGKRVVMRRDVANITMNLDRLEEIDTLALGGADVFRVGDLAGTPVDLVDVSLAPAFGSPGGDGLADRIDVTSGGRSKLVLAASRTTATLTGLAGGARVNVTHAEAADTLAVHTGGRPDRVDASGADPATIGVVVD